MGWVAPNLYHVFAPNKLLVVQEKFFLKLSSFTWCTSLMVAIHCGKMFICYCFNLHIRRRQLNFFCTGLTEPNFWQIKIIIPISHTFFLKNFYFFEWDIFLLDHNKIHKKVNIIEWWKAEMWSISHVTCAQVSLTHWAIFLFLDVPTLKFRIMIIILLSEWLDTILPTAHTTEN